ncbi:MAG: ATP-binding protein [Myxococcota bacterium]
MDGSSPRTDRRHHSRGPRPFVGRADEVEALNRATQRAAVVSLLGPPGVGKTRLAYEAARLREQGQGSGPARVVWVSLLHVHQPRELWEALQTALGVAAEGELDDWVSAGLEVLTAVAADLVVWGKMETCS